MGEKEICHPEATALSSLKDLPLFGEKKTCHPEATALSSLKDPGEPRDVPRPLRHNNRASGSLPYLCLSAARPPKRKKPLPTIRSEGAKFSHLGYTKIISPQPIAVNKIVPFPEERIPTKVDPSKVDIAPFVIPTRERSETGGICCEPATNHPRVPHPCRVLCGRVGILTFSQERVRLQPCQFRFSARGTLLARLPHTWRVQYHCPCGTRPLRRKSWN